MRGARENAGAQRRFDEEDETPPTRSVRRTRERVVTTGVVLERVRLLPSSLYSIVTERTVFPALVAYSQKALYLLDSRLKGWRNHEQITSDS